MSFEKQYYDFERFWNNPAYSYKINIEKIRITLNYISSQGDITSLLDAACGNGIFTNMALERFPEKKIVGFDRSETALKYVKAEKLLANIDDIPFPDYSFDCVVAHDVLEHLPVTVYSKAVEEIARVAGKYIIIAVPYNEKLEDNVSQCPSCRTIFNNDLHFRNFDKDSMKSLFKRSGFDCIDIKTCEPNTFYKGQKLYGDLFYRKWKMHFRSPICPLCGYKTPDDENPLFKVGVDQEKKQKGVVSYLKAIPKLIWPKYSQDYEMVALFKR